MDEYKVEIKETLSRIVTIVAASERDAIGIVETQYANEKIILDASDYDGVEIEVVK